MRMPSKTWLRRSRSWGYFSRLSFDRIQSRAEATLLSTASGAGRPRNWSD